MLLKKVKKSNHLIQKYFKNGLNDPIKNIYENPLIWKVLKDSLFYSLDIHKEDMKHFKSLL